MMKQGIPFEPIPRRGWGGPAPVGGAAGRCPRNGGLRTAEERTVSAREAAERAIRAARLPPSRLCDDEVPTRVHANPIPTGDGAPPCDILTALELQNRILTEILRALRER